MGTYSSVAGATSVIREGTIRRVLVRVSTFVFVWLAFWETTSRTVNGGMAPTLRVTVDRESPAYAAFEDQDLELPELVSSEPIAETPSPALTVNRQAAIELFEGREKTREVPPPYRQAGAIIISRSEPESIPARVMTELDLDQRLIKDGELLPLSARKELLASYFAPEDVAGPTIGDEVRRLVQASLEGGNPAERQQVVLAASPLRIPRPDRPLSTGGTAKLQLGGRLLMANGLAYLGGQGGLAVFQVVGGSEVAHGQVNIETGRYDIDLVAMEGFLIAELRDSQDQIIGLAEVNLYDLEASAQRVDLKLSPFLYGAHLVARSLWSWASPWKKPLRNLSLFVEDVGQIAYSEDDGHFVNSLLTEPSYFLLKAEADDHVPSLSVAVAGRPQSSYLVPSGLLESLYGLTRGARDLSDFRTEGVVWGRVLVNGSPRAGVRVEMSGTAVKPIYFVNYLPHVRSTMTSADGMFAFVGVVPGVHVIRAVDGVTGEDWAVDFSVTEPGRVSVVELEKQPETNLEFHSFDYFTGRDIPVQFQLAGTDRQFSMSSSGRWLVPWPQSDRVQIVEVYPRSDYLPLRIPVVGPQRTVQMPLLSRSWFNQVSGWQRSNIDPNRGAVVGLVGQKNAAYEVTVNGSGVPPVGEERLVYFDTRGRPIKSNQGVPGGGFALIGLQPGRHTVAITDLVTGAVKTAIVVIDSDIVTLLNWR